VNCRSVPWARAFTSIAPARSTIQASACRELPSPKLTNKKNIYVYIPMDQYANAAPLYPKCAISQITTSQRSISNELHCNAKQNLILIFL